jgi:TonB-dependent starch-binding outer membrane protein SusC
VGVIANRGLETRVTVVPVDRPAVRLTLVGAYNTLHNRMIDMRGTPPFAIGGLSAGSAQNIVEEGFPVGYLRGSKGVFDESGRVTFVPNAYLGNPTADKFGSYAASLSLGRRLTLGADGDYQFGAQAVSFDRGFRFLYGVKGTERDVPAATLAQFSNNRAAMWLNMMNVFVENTDYVVLRHLSADYRLPERYLPWRVRDARLQFAVTNPFIWAASSFDPEITLSGATEQGGPSVGGFNYSTESRPRTYLLTLRLGI